MEAWHIYKESHDVTPTRACITTLDEKLGLDADSKLVVLVDTGSSLAR